MFAGDFDLGKEFYIARKCSVYKNVEKWRLYGAIIKLETYEKPRPNEHG